MDNRSSQLSKCLSELLNILNVNGSNLARAINVDPAVVSRWKTGKRAIPVKSNYLELISNYLASNVTTKLQEENIKSFAEKFYIQDSTEIQINMKEYIHKILLSAYENSYIKYDQNNKHTQKDILFDVNQKWKTTDIERANTIPISISNANIKVIMGHQSIIQAGINLLKSALEKPYCSKEPIVISFLTELDSFSDFKESYFEWNKVLDEVIKKGWNITKITRLNENMNRNFKIINEIIRYCLLERYFPYYIKNYDLNCLTDLMIVPTIGVLLCFCSQNSHKIDSAFLLEDKHSIEILKGLSTQFINKSLPLLNSRHTTNKTLNILSEITKLEQKNGDQFAYKNGLSSLVIPLDLYEKCLLFHRGKMTDLEIRKKNFLSQKKT